MNRAISGTVFERETGRPLRGLRVVAARLVPDGLELLGAAVVGDLGKFRITYGPLAEPADLTLLIYLPCGRLVYQEPVHRAIGGAELRLQVEVARKELVADLH